MPVINSVAEMKEEVSEWRRALHENPQTAYEEEFASELIAKKLSEWGIPHKKGIAKTGIVATIEGQKTDSGKSIGLRADIDALDITEKSGTEWCSKTPGKMHACGHDGHTATLLGVAKYLNETKNFNGTVHLIFQPAEEGEGGAMKMIEEGMFKEFPCDYVFAYHNWPWMPLGTIATRVGPLLASVDEFTIEITGEGGHAAMPHGTIDPSVITSHLITALQSIVSRNVDPIETAVVSICNVNIGTGAFNIIGDTAVINGTVRTFNNDVRKLISKRIHALVNHICEGFGASAKVDLQEMIDPTINTQDGVEMAAKAARSVVEEDAIDLDCPPCMGGEDFGAMLSSTPGAMVLIGQGDANNDNSPHNYGLHSPYYDFNDEVLPVGISFFAKLVEQNLALD